MAEAPRRGRDSEAVPGSRLSVALATADATVLSTIAGAMVLSAAAAEAARRGEGDAHGAARGQGQAPDPPPDAAAPPQATDATIGADSLPAGTDVVGTVSEPAPGAASASARDSVDVSPHASAAAERRQAEEVRADEAPPSTPAMGANEAAGSQTSAAAPAGIGTASGSSAANASTPEPLGTTPPTADAAVILPQPGNDDLLSNALALIDATVERIASSIDEVGQSLTDAAATVTQVVTQIVDLPAELLGGIGEPVAAAALLANTIEEVAPVTEAIQSGLDSLSQELNGLAEPLQLGFLGQSYADGMDAQDAAFTILGIHA